MKDYERTYWNNLREAAKTSMDGLSLTWNHFKEAISSPSQKAIGAAEQSFVNSISGIVTNRYPHEMMPIPDNGRYKLHNEIEDCIVCDKCAQICPVNCIDIEAIRGVEQVGTASDGSPIRFYAAVFDIDMAKCFYCGLCTTVCPTECLTMTKDFDFSTFEIGKMNYGFGNITQEEAEQKRKEWEQHQEEKKKSHSKSKLEPKITVKKKINTENTNKTEENLAKTTDKKPLKVKLPLKTSSEKQAPKVKIKVPSDKSNSEEKPVKIKLKASPKKIVPKIKIKKPPKSGEGEK